MRKASTSSTRLAKPPPQAVSKGHRRQLDKRWLAYICAGGNAGDGSSLENDPALISGIAQFNHGLYYESHEAFEDIWQRTLYPQRLLCLALTKFAAACVHKAKGNYTGANRIGRHSLTCFLCLPKDYARLDVRSLCQGIADWLGSEDNTPIISRINYSA